MKKQSIGISIIMVISMITGCVFKNEKLQLIDSYLGDLHESNQFDGTLVIGNKEGIIYSSSFGVADRTWGILIDNQTRFDIASLNKSFIAHMIMQLVEADKVSLDDSIYTYLEELPEEMGKVTIHQMLSHTSGMPNYGDMPDSLKMKEFEPFKRMHFESNEYISFIGSLPMNGAPGQQFYYSNFAYHLLSILIEKVERKHFTEALDSMICRPLSLSKTFAPADNYLIYDQLASSYQWRDGQYLKSPFIDYSLGRRIFSTSTDLYKWGLEMVNPSLISGESKKLILSNHIKAINPNISYGYGWAVFDGEGDYQMGKLDVPDNYFIHGGSTDGYRSLLVVYDDGEWIVALLGNIGNQINELKTVESVLKILIEE